MIDSSAPLVAIVIPTWNRRDDVLRCVGSIDRLKYPHLLSIVVDNGSEDDTVPALRARYPGFTVIENGANLGYAGGNNVGIRRALAEGARYVWLVNNDAEAPPGLLGDLVRVAEADRAIGVVGCRNLRLETPTRLWGAYGSLTYGPFVVWTEGQGAADGADWQVDNDVDWVIGNGSLWRAEALEEAGLFDEEFFAYHDDVDLCMRVRQAGYRIVYAGAAAILHRGGVSSDASYEQRFPMPYFLGRNGVRLVRKHGRWRDRTRFAATCGAAMGLRWLRAAALRSCPASGRVRERGKAHWAWETAYLGGLLDGLRGRPVPFARLGLANSRCSLP